MLIAAVITYAFRNPWFRGNFGVVDAGQVYRSAQPMGELASVIAANKIRTVLNLRGGSEADPWYAAEVAETPPTWRRLLRLPPHRHRPPDPQAVCSRCSTSWIGASTRCSSIASPAPIAQAWSAAFI